MFVKTPVARAAVLVLAGTWALTVAAQQQPADDTQGQSREKIEITGSRIKRVDAETPSPVQVITREQIERSGATSITELLKNVPANNAGGFDVNAVASFTPGAGGVSLRGLGPQATLILINGRRVAPYGFASGGQQTFVDVNSIPIEVVDRVETLLDGASAIYGSDAIAGVINIITRKDYNGASALLGYGQSNYHDADKQQLSLSFGKGKLETDGYNVFANISHNHQDPVKANARPNTSTGDLRRFGLTDLRSQYSYPGNLIRVSDGSFFGPMPGCTPLNDPTAAANGRCFYQGTDHQDVVAESQRDSLFVGGSMSMGRDLELFGDLTLVRTKFAMESPSYSTSTYFSTGTLADPFIVLPVGHPQNPSNEDLGLRYRFMDTLHFTRVQSDLQRLVLGVRGTVAGWDGETALMSARSNTKVHTTGLINDNVLLNEVLDANGNALNTFTFGNPSANDPGLMSRLYPDLQDVGKTATTSLDVRASRDLMQLPAGPLGFAFGLEVRHESFNTKPDPLTESGAISVLGGSSSDGSRNVSAAYAEFSVPVFKTLEASLAARVDHYSDFGSATTPKVGLKWKALPMLVLRGTYAEGFRAPALTELTQSPSRGFFSIRDPKLCPDPSDTTNPNCDLSVLAISGSNPKLQPEKSKNMTVGLVFEPMRNLSFTADYYRIKRRDEISSIDPDYLLANEGMFPGYVVRDPNTNVIQQLNLQYTNLGSTRVEGYDIEGKGTFDVGALGKLSLNATYNRTPHYWVANVKGAQELDYAGTYLQPKERMQFGFDLEHGPYSGGLTWNYIGSYLRAYTPTDLSCPYSNGAHPELCAVKSWLTADLFLRWVPIKNLELNLTMTNIENKQAPIDERMATRYTLFNSTYHDQVGRFTKVTARYTFW